MDTLQTMRVFVRVAQRAGFAAAARDLRLSPAAVTKHVISLETRLGVRLFDRTTRSVALTEAGRIYLEHCLECLQSIEDADASVSELSRSPKGMLRVTAPVDMQVPLSPVVARFMIANPDVQVDLQLSNRVVDLVEEGIDVAVRVAASLDNRYVARPLAQVRMLMLAAPSYLQRHGRPRDPQALEGHRHLIFVEPRPRDEYTLERNGERVRVKLQAAMTTNSGAALRAAVTEGVGIAAMPSFLVRDELEAGRIEVLLTDWTILPRLGLHAVYPHRRFLAPKVRSFVEALQAAFGDAAADPWWPADPLGASAVATRRSGARRASRACAGTPASRDNTRRQG